MTASDSDDDVEIAAIYLRGLGASENYIEDCREATSDPDPTIYQDSGGEIEECTNFKQLLEDLYLSSYDVVITPHHDEIPSVDGGLIAVFLHLMKRHDIDLRYTVGGVDTVDGNLLPWFEWDTGFERAVERHNLHTLKGEFRTEY